MNLDGLQVEHRGSYGTRKTLTKKQQISKHSPNISPKCVNCGGTLDLGDTKNGKDREFCRYGGRPECGECARFFSEGHEHCPDCTVELKIKIKCDNCNRILKGDSKSSPCRCTKCEKPVTVQKKCSRCETEHEKNDIDCKNCKIKLRIPACVKEYSMYIAKLNQIRNELMANPHERLKMNMIHEIFMKHISISKSQDTLEKLVQVEIED